MTLDSLTDAIEKAKIAEEESDIESKTAEEIKKSRHVRAKIRLPDYELSEEEVPTKKKSKMLPSFPPEPKGVKILHDITCAANVAHRSKGFGTHEGNMFLYMAGQ